MKNLLHPKWILIVHTLPVMLLLSLFFTQYQLIESLLTNNQRLHWLVFAIVLLGITLFSTGYALWSMVSKKSYHLGYAIVSMVINCAYLYCYSINIDLLLPFNIPNWMLISDLYLYPGTFLMPSLAHALFILVVRSVPEGRKANPWLNFLYSLIFPLLSYIFIMVILPLWQPVHENFGTHVLVVLFIAATVLFLFFIARGSFLLSTMHAKGLIKYEIYFKIVIGILLPICGLLLNNGVFEAQLIEANIFGNFSGPWFYLLAFLNGVVLCLPKFKNHYARLFRFFALAAFFPYTFYFFLVFLPYLPLAIVAIIFVGLGFLMLAPLCLFIVQVNDLYHEFRFFSKSYAAKMILLSIILGGAIIPSLITINYLHDKFTLNKALNEVFDQTHSDPVNRNSLRHTLTQIKNNKDRGNFAGTNHLPFLSVYYNWLVLDNLTLADSKISVLERIFFGETTIRLYPERNDSDKDVNMINYKIESNYDQAQGAWTSTLNLTLQHTGKTNFALYETTFDLPEGCWISDYYLYVGKRKEKGILAEKRAARWIFNNIRNENRDPGLLYYLTGNKIALKIFPFASKEIRTSGITFVHKVPMTLNIDGKIIHLGNDRVTTDQKIEKIGQTTYIPANEKAKLKLVQRKPAYHFIIDGSKGKNRNVSTYVEQIENFLKVNAVSSNNVHLDFSNAYQTTLPFVKGWQTDLKNQAFEGGFYLQGAIRRILTDSYQNPTQSYPIMIVISDSLSNAIVMQDFGNLNAAYPEGAVFYELEKNGRIWTHALDENPLQRQQLIKAINLNCPVYAWPNVNRPTAYLSTAATASIMVNDKDNERAGKIDNETGLETVPFRAKSWTAGLHQHGLWMASQLTDNKQQNTEYELVKLSMSNQLMSPLTSFVVVENEAQKKALLKKQQEILAGNKNLDPDEDTQRMSEPGLFLVLALMLVWIGWKLRMEINLIAVAEHGSEN
jgi:hypothetical protein